MPPAAVEAGLPTIGRAAQGSSLSAGHPQQLGLIPSRKSSLQGTGVHLSGQSLVSSHSVSLDHGCADEGLANHPYITWPLPTSQILPFDPVETESDTVPFPDYPDPVKNLILARTALLDHLSSIKHRGAHPNLHPMRAFGSIHSRIMPKTGHIKENEDLNRSKVSVSRVLRRTQQVRADRLKGNKSKSLSQRHAFANKARRGKSLQPRDSLKRILKKSFSEALREATSYEREHGWNIITSTNLDGRSNVTDASSQLCLAAPLQPGSEITRRVVTSLLKLKQTFPELYSSVFIDSTAVRVGLNGYPEAEHPQQAVKRLLKMFKQPRQLLLGPFDDRRSSETTSVAQASSISSTNSSAPVATSAPRSSYPVCKTFGAKAMKFLRRMASKIGRRVAKHRLSRKSASSTPDVKKGPPVEDGDDQDSDDEYVLAAEFLAQEEQNKARVSAWLETSPNGESDDDAGLIEVGPFERGCSPPLYVVGQTTRSSISSPVPQTLATSHDLSGKQELGETSELPPRTELPDLLSIPTFSGFEGISQSWEMCGSGPEESNQSGAATSMGNNSHVGHATIAERPTTPARLVSVHKTGLKVSNNVAFLKRPESIPFRKEDVPRALRHARKAMDLRAQADVETRAEFEASAPYVDDRQFPLVDFLTDDTLRDEKLASGHPSSFLQSASILSLSQRQQDFLDRQLQESQTRGNQSGSKAAARHQRLQNKT